MESEIDLDNALWKFSVAVYAAPGVEQQCLALQDAFDIDVNVLLFCAWLAVAQRGALFSGDIKAIEELVRAWHAAAVRPLRIARRGIKALPEAALDEVQALRKRIAEDELHAERIEQALLFAQAENIGQSDRHSPLRNIITANLDVYLQTIRSRRSPGEFPIDSLIEAAVASATQQAIS